MGEFAPEGGPALDALVQEHLAHIASRVQQELGQAQIDCLVLGGGYGRGEGGVLHSDDPDQPEQVYNDYDLVLVHPDATDTATLQPQLDALGHELGGYCGIHVDITPISRSRVPQLPPALTWYELAQGHKVVLGDEAVLQPLLQRRLQDVDVGEWGRLLVNRGSGLYFADLLMRQEACPVLGDEEPLAFCWRQIEKAWLALGDVFLADAGLYHDRLLQRLPRMQELPAGQRPAWHQRWAEAAAFKFCPRLRPEGEASALTARIKEEVQQLRPLYADSLATRPASLPRLTVGCYATLRFLPPSLWCATPPWRYPRERLRLALVAWGRDQATAFRRQVGSASGFQALWARFG